MRIRKAPCQAIVSTMLILLLGLYAFPQGAGTSGDVAERIVGAAMNRGGAISFLETLTDTVGGRITGGPESRATSDLILKELR